MVFDDAKQERDPQLIKITIVQSVFKNYAYYDDDQANGAFF